MLQLTLPPNRNPNLQPYARADAAPIGSAIPGTAVVGRSTLYNFDVSALPNGDYVVDIDSPYGRFVLRKFDTTYLMADEWWQLDYLVDQSTNISRVLVDQDYGGPGALTYVLDGIPVADASIELFLFSDYTAGNRTVEYNLNNSRQCVDGRWLVPFYLDPQTYVLRFYRAGVAGPDAWKVVVSFDPAEISITPLDVVTGGIILGFKQKAAAKSVAVLPDLPKVKKSAPSQLKQKAAVPVDHNYGGPFKLVYGVKGKPVANATIQVYLASDYNQGTRVKQNVVAQTEQRADGSWTQPVMLVPGRYVLHCFKKGEAGPDSYNLVVN
jgi:hypothetical protein